MLPKGGTPTRSCDSKFGVRARLAERLKAELQTPSRGEFRVRALARFPAV